MKQLPLTMGQIEREIDSRYGRFDQAAKIRGTNSIARVIINVRAPILEKWSMAIVLVGNGRIDGIDWEGRIEDHRGRQYDCTGWHRHMWKPGSADKHKECLPKFRPKSSARDFIATGFRVLNVAIKEARDASGKLPLA